MPRPAWRSADLDAVPAHALERVTGGDRCGSFTSWAFLGRGTEALRADTALW